MKHWLGVAGVLALCLGPAPLSASAQPSADPLPTPPGCHWSDHGDGKAQLWCKDSVGETHPTGQLQAANLGSGDGCPANSFYNGVQCIPALNATAPDRRPPLTPAEQVEQRTFLTGLAKSLDEVVTADSASWLSNRYDRGSMGNTKTLAHGKDRKSALVYGEYTYNGGRHGWVKARIANGQYTCLEFWNEHSCRALGHPESHQVVAGLLMAMFAGAMSGGGGGGGHGHYDEGRREIIIQRPGEAPPPPPPAPITPIGGDRGLYGADHSCC